MTSPQARLNPARSDDRGSALCALELVASGGMQLVEVVRAEVRNRMTLEPCPQILDGIELGTVGRQEGHVNMSVEGIQIVAHHRGAMGPRTTPGEQQRLFGGCLRRLKKP